MELPSNPDLFMFASTADPGSPTQDRIQLLGNLAATRDAQAEIEKSDHE